MKKYLALLLSMLLLVGCARIEPEQGGTKPEPGQPDDVSAKLLSQYALAEVKLPELPAEPSEEELWAAYEKLDYDKMGEDAYHKAQEELWDDFDARSRAYSDAVKALRGEGVDKTMTPALLGYSTKTVSKLLGGEAAANVVYSPANLYLALSMLTETVDGETRAQLLDLLGAEDEETVRTTANAIWRSLYTDSANSKTLLANSLWLSEGQAYKTETVERLANDYYASVFSAPMGTGDTNKAVQAWLNTNTGGLLADAAKNIETKPETVMLLLSTLYFKDRWSDEFYDGATSEDTFTAADGDLPEGVTEYYTEDSGLGVVVTAQNKSFGGTITVMVGIDAKGAITGVKVTDHADTPGLGTKAMDSGYLAQYQTLTQLDDVDNIKKDSQVDEVTGATVSSNGIYGCVKYALAAYEEMGGLK